MNLLNSLAKKGYKYIYKIDNKSFYATKSKRKKDGTFSNDSTFDTYEIETKEEGIMVEVLPENTFINIETC